MTNTPEHECPLRPSAPSVDAGHSRERIQQLERWWSNPATNLKNEVPMTNWQIFWREFWITVRDDLSIGPVRRWLKQRRQK